MESESVKIESNENESVEKIGNTDKFEKVDDGLQEIVENDVTLEDVVEKNNDGMDEIIASGKHVKRG